MKNDNIFSHHIFYFSFKINIIERKDRKIFYNNKDNLWVRVNKDNNNTTATYKKEIFDTESFYHKFIHNSILDTNEINKNENILKHYERKEIKENDIKFRVYYDLQSGTNNSYLLNIEKITLDIFDSTIGILSIYTNNNKYPNKEDICYINSLFRYLYRPYYDYKDIIDISFTGKTYECKKAIKGDEKSWSLATHINNLMIDFSNLIKKNIEIVPAFDNKMFVSSWYYNEDLAKSLKNATIRDLGDNTFWQNYIFVDTNKEGYGINNEEMRYDITKNASYLRWQNNGTLYGISTESFVCLTCNKEKTFNPMTIIYPHMLRIILFQRASFLALSDEISKFSKEPDLKHINDIYEQYLKYVRNLYYNEVTPQIQGMELYKKLQETFKLKENFIEYNYKISKIHNYHQTKEELERKEDQNNILNFIAAVFLPGSLIAGLFGMNYKGDTKPFFLEELLLIILGTIIILLIFNTNEDYKNTVGNFFKRINITKTVIIFIVIFVINILCMIFGITGDILKWFEVILKESENVK